MKTIIEVRYGIVSVLIYQQFDKINYIYLTRISLKIDCNHLFQVNPFTTPESLDHGIRIQSAVRVSEVALSDKDGCLRRSMCVLGAISSTRENDNLPKMSIANGAQNFLHIVERMIAVAGMTGLTKDQLPNSRQVIARYKCKYSMNYYFSSNNYIIFVTVEILIYSYHILAMLLENLLVTLECAKVCSHVKLL